MEGMRITIPGGSKRPNLFGTNSQNINIQNFNNPFKNNNNEKKECQIHLFNQTQIIQKQIIIIPQIKIQHSEMKKIHLNNIIKTQ